MVKYRQNFSLIIAYDNDYIDILYISFLVKEFLELRLEFTKKLVHTEILLIPLFMGYFYDVSDYTSSNGRMISELERI
jgi:hypothetical protein